MLKSLSIKNYALLVDFEVEFGAGLNIITGETGAGKSIILNALGTILGDRVDTTAIRSGTSKAMIEGRFSLGDNTTLRSLLEQNELYETDDQMILRREIYDNSRSRAFINDSPVPLALLQQVSDLLVDMHGQHDHQSLLRLESHLNFLDEYGKLGPELQDLSDAHQKLVRLTEEQEQLKSQENSLREKKEFYTFQINEINKINPRPEEEEELVREETILKNSEKLFNLTSDIYHVLYEDAASIFDQLNRVKGGLDELGTIDDRFKLLEKDCDSARIAVEELAKFIQNYNSNIEFNSNRLEEIQSRLSSFANLKKKYGGTLEEVSHYRNKIQNELANFESLSDRMEAIQDQISLARTRFSQGCLELSAKRRKVAKQIEALVPEILSMLGISGSSFKVEFRHITDSNGLADVDGTCYRATARGMDFAEFFISTNVGEPLKPLAKVVSGGEISRIMLALKSVAAEQDQIPVLVFDEIDIGVSGRIAQAVGRKLKELSKFHQVICITHLPQIASMGDNHYLVEKSQNRGRTESRIRQLDPEERTEAIARLMAGETISDTHLQSAKELLEDTLF
ncbi:MAG: DNA repair protein RecN [bacterium]